ncbi:hypothetical protein E2C01_067043 [Portunus trituberculatus]|uniref:Uncharacterized protein n=1 Tax=Portunus trituberculatus TaxID=210409 RepID=A0A5B7HJT5_PORTR|nr:hypothetical protein [Portunus trituberculatus]
MSEPDPFATCHAGASRESCTAFSRRKYLRFRANLRYQNIPATMHPTYSVPHTSGCVPHKSVVRASASGAGGGVAYFLVSTTYALRASAASHVYTHTYVHATCF